MADWIVSRFPEHRSYLEPFFGSGAVLFNKPVSPIETINDMDGDVVNLFEWIRDDPEKLADQIRKVPYARDMYEQAFAKRYSEKDPLKRAVYFYIRMMMGHGFRTAGGKVGWKHDVHGREAAYAVQHWNDIPNMILQATERLKLVQIENQPAAKVISRFNYPNVLIYADPPYLMSTRYGKQYKCEMTDADHEELLDLLKKHSGPVLLSGYESPLYAESLKEWNCEKISSRTQIGAEKTECLWMNFNPQISFFDMEE